MLCRAKQVFRVSHVECVPGLPQQAGYWVAILEPQEKVHCLEFAFLEAVGAQHWAGPWVACMGTLYPYCSKSVVFGPGASPRAWLEMEPQAPV